MILNKTKEFTKIILINIFILAGLFTAPSIFLKFFNKIKSNLNLVQNKTSDPRVSYPTYKNRDFANQLFSDNSKLSMQYYAFIGWKRKPFKSKYINIKGNYKTRISLGEDIENSTWFFGGSTIFGTGSSDKQTIPSHYNQLSNDNVFNFGETSWNSRQSLNLLINLIADGEFPKKIIFYDGVNDVLTFCRTEIKNLPSHAYVNKIREKLFTSEQKLFAKKITNFIVEPYISLFKKDELIPENAYDCHKNTNKSRRIARHLVENWHIAYLISKKQGAEFKGILQPTIFSSGVKYDYFDNKSKNRLNLFKAQYESVYPEIINEMKQKCKTDRDFCESLVDGRYWLSGKENIFIDWCHVNGAGNQIIAEKMIQNI